MSNCKIMIEKIIEPVAKVGVKAVGKCVKAITKEGVRKGAQVAGQLAAMIMTGIFSAWLTSRHKDKVFGEFLKKHDDETARRLSAQFNKELEMLKREITRLREQLQLTKEEAEAILRKRLAEICERYGLSPDDVLE